MRHRVRKGKLGLKTEHRLSLLKNLSTELLGTEELLQLMLGLRN